MQVSHDGSAPHETTGGRNRRRKRANRKNKNRVNSPHPLPTPPTPPPPPLPCVDVPKAVCTLQHVTPKLPDELECTPEGVVYIYGADGSKYRRSVCAIIMNRDGFFLGCRRCDDRKVLQSVQGGLNAGETVLQTAEREMFEEIGLSANQVQFICEILPVGVEALPRGEERAPFRYNSKSWRKLGIKGQELYPLLYLADASVLSKARFNAVPGERKEFCQVQWIRLAEFLKRCSPSKREVTANICAAVAPIASNLIGAQFSSGV